MKTALFNLGFRPFFLFGSVYAVISIFVWVQVYSGQYSHTFSFSSPMLWHAHEMIFGYAMAAITGFLLTAVRNWSGITTINGLLLFLLLLCWLIARVLSFFDFRLWQFIFDNLYLIGFIIALTIPVVKAKHWKSFGIITKILLILASNILFYLGAAGSFEDGERIGLFSALYLIISLVLMLSRRVMPMFIQNGVGYPVTLTNRAWLDRACLILFLLFWIADVSSPDGKIATLLAVILFVLHSIRISGWYTPGIWKQPLLWSLYLAYGFLILGFLLKILAGITGLSPNLAVHAFTYGGIGMMTLSMMSRVSKGHTGRAIYEPSGALFWMFVILFFGAIVRVIFPIIDMSHYMLWIKWSHIHWLVAYTIFVFLYLPILIGPRVDGKPG